MIIDRLRSRWFSIRRVSPVVVRVGVRVRVRVRVRVGARVAQQVVLDQKSLACCG